MSRKHDIYTMRLSQWILYVLIGLAALVFVAFFTIGFDRLSVDEPEFNNPVFTDVLLLFMVVMTLAATVAGVWSFAVSVRMKRKEFAEARHASEERKRLRFATVLSFVIAVFTVIALILFYLLGSSEAMPINGETFDDTFWLKTSDMFINTSLLLLFVAVGASCVGLLKMRKKEGGQ